MRRLFRHSGAFLQAVIYIAILLVLGLVSFVFGDQMSDLFGDMWNAIPYIVGVLLVLVGAWRVGQRILQDERSRLSTGDQSRMEFLIVAAVALSAVSFLTTLFGLFGFASASSETPGQQIAFWVISVGTTFGIQVILFVISLVLGERLVELRPRKDDAYHAGLQQTDRYSYGEDRPTATQRWMQSFGLIVGIVFGMLLLLIGLSAFGLVDLPGAWRALLGQFTGEGQNSYVVGIVFAVLALMIFRVTGLIGSLWHLMVPSFLLFVYGGTLLVSSAFSFDSYYSLVQNSEDIATRRGNIVRDETTRLLARAEAALLDADRELREGVRGQALATQVEAGIDQLIESANQLEEAFQRAVDLQIAQEQERSRQIVSQLTALKEQEDAELRVVVADASTRAGLSATILALEGTQSAAQQRLESARESLVALNQDMLHKRALADCEEHGLNEGICEGRSGIPKCGPRCRKLRGQADRIEAVQIPDAQRQVAQAEANLEEITTRLSAENLRLIAASASPEENAARAEAIRERYARQREQLEKARANLGGGGDARAPTGAFDVNTLRSDFATFYSNPNTDNLQSYVSNCQRVRDILLSESSTADMVRDFSCQPPSLLSFQAQHASILAARVEFQRMCRSDQNPASAPANEGSGFAPAPPLPVDDVAAPGAMAPSAVVAFNSNDLVPLRALAEHTRECLAIASGIEVMLTGGEGGGRLQGAENDLIELSGVYLSEERDIRRSFADLWRGTDYAVATFAGAVLVDILILVLGFLVAVARPSVMYDNPFDPNLEQLEKDLGNIAAWYSSDRKPATGMRIFNSYLEERFIHPRGPHEPANPELIYRMTVNKDAVRPEHERLVTSILNALPPRYRQTVTFSSVASGTDKAEGWRTAINDRVVSMITSIAHQDPQSRQPGDEDGEFGGGGSEMQTFNLELLPVKPATQSGNAGGSGGTPRRSSNGGTLA